MFLLKDAFDITEIYHKTTTLLSFNFDVNIQGLKKWQKQHQRSFFLFSNKNE